jgi:putative ABC transport system substrate-binding protein
LFGVCAVLVSLVSGCAPAAAPTAAPTVAATRQVNIGIVQFTTHPALDASRDGARKALEDAGFKEGANAHYDLQNAQGQIPTLTTIAQRYRDAKMDLIVIVSTPALQATANVFKDATTPPLVFNAVTDPYAAVTTIKSETDKPANITGVQALPPVKDAMQLAQKVVPSAKRFGIVWNPAEANSEVATRIAREAAKELNVELVEATVSSADEVLQGAQSLITKNIDVFFITTDSTVVSAIEALVRVANENKKPFFANDPATAQRGAVAALGLDYYDQGFESGKLAAQILQGTPAAQVPIRKAQKGSLSINLKAAELQGATLPADVVAQAKDKFNEIAPAKP